MSTASSWLNLCAFCIHHLCAVSFISSCFCYSLLLLLKFNFTMKTLINCSFNALLQLPFVHFQTRHEVNCERVLSFYLSIPFCFERDRKNRKNACTIFFWLVLCVSSTIFFVQFIYKFNKNLFAQQRGNSASTHWILIKSTS